MDRKADKEQKHPSAVVGEVAEHTRSFLAKKGAKPPGLQTVTNSDGSMSVISDNPEVGLVLKVDITLLKMTEPVATPSPQPMENPALPGNLSGVGLGPQPQPVTPMQAPSQVPTGVGLGPA